jgi:predicted ATPase
MATREGLAVLAEALACVDTGERYAEAGCTAARQPLLQQRRRTRSGRTLFSPRPRHCSPPGSQVRELRAATSLSRLWQQQGKCAEAHKMLAPIYGWFTEGFDTADLQDAKTLLEELAG